MYLSLFQIKESLVGSDSYLGQEQQEVVLDLSTKDLWSGLVGELDDDGHGLHEHPGLEHFLSEGLSLELDTVLLKLLGR